MKGEEMGSHLSVFLWKLFQYFIRIFIQFSNSTEECLSAAKQALVACTLAEWARNLVLLFKR